jgi:type IV pilus assembly protein PilB
MSKRPKLGELLVMAGAINQTQLGAALGDQRQYGRPLGITLVRLGYLDEETLVRTLARQLKLPTAWLRGKWVGREVLDLVPAELALKHRCLPLAVNDDGRGKVLHLAMQDPQDLEALDAIRFHVGHNVSPVLAAPSELEEALHRHYESGNSEGRASANQPEVQEVPELLMFETKAQATTPESGLEFATGPSEASSMSSENVISGLMQLVKVLMDKGILSREEVVQCFPGFPTTNTTDR